MLFKKKENKKEDNHFQKITSLLIHAAKIDENYTESEKKLVLNFINNFAEDKTKIKVLLDEAEKFESNSNQLLNYTQIIKNSSKEIKSEIIEQLWKILISDNTVDQFESNLMRRICGLIYFSDKDSGEIKMKLMKTK